MHYTHLQEGYYPILKEGKTKKSTAAKCWHTQRHTLYHTIRKFPVTADKQK